MEHLSDTISDFFACLGFDCDSRTNPVDRGRVPVGTALVDSVGSVDFVGFVDYWIFDFADSGP